MRTSTLWWIAIGLLTVHLAGATVAWFGLPARVPIHFGFRGTPDAWASTSMVTWFGPLVISGAMSWFIYAVTRHGPLELWNIPEKQRFLRLPAERQAPILDRLHAFAAVCAICTTITFMALQVGIYLTARGLTSTLPWYIHLLMLGPMAFLVLGSVRLSRTVRRAVQQASTAP